VYFQDDRLASKQGEGEKHISVLLSEFAPFGDLFDLVMDPSYPMNEVLARTLFR